MLATHETQDSTIVMSTLDAEEDNASQEKESQESESDEGEYVHAPIVIQSAAKTPRVFTDAEREQKHRESIFQAMEMEGGLNDEAANFDGY